MRLAALSIVLVAACERPPPPPVPPVPPGDELLACRVDADCVIATSCCAHCTPSGTVVSVAETFREVGEALTLSLYCPACAEAGCTHPAPTRTPICKQQRCARRDVYVTDAARTTIAKTEEIATDPALLARGLDTVLG